MNVYRIWCNLKEGVRDTEFHLTLDTEDLAQLERAFAHVAARAEPVESFHQAVNSKVRDVVFALYRDFPDAVRVRGEERF